MEYDVFISYSSTDMDVAQKVYAYLQQKGIKPWIAPQCIPAGEPYARAIINGISKCRLMVVILSEASNASDDVLNEVDQAHREKKIILPFIIDKTEMSGEMKYYLSRKQWINAYPNVTSAQCEALFDAITAYLPAHEETEPEMEKLQEEQQEIKPEDNLPEEQTAIASEKTNDSGRTMMEKFPEMNLVPTSLYDWRKPKKSRVLSVIFFIISLLPLCMLMMCLIDCATLAFEGMPQYDEISIAECDSLDFYQELYGKEIPQYDRIDASYQYYLMRLSYDESVCGRMLSAWVNITEENIPNICRLGYTEEELRQNVLTFVIDRRADELRSKKIEWIPMMIVFFVYAIPFLFLGWLFYARYPKKNSPTLLSLANYIQKYRYKRWTRLGKKPQFVFFVKDCLFGVMNVADYKVQIPAEYERISWKAKDALIKVTKDGHDFLIDINGERLQ